MKATTKPRISSGQLLALMVNFLLASAFIIIPSAVVGGAAQDGWLCVLLALMAAVPLARLYPALSEVFPGKSLVEACREALGHTIGTVLATCFLWFALHLGALVVRNFGDFLVVTLLPGTPQVVIHGLTMVVVVAGLLGGLEVLSRLNQMTILVVLPSVALFLLLCLTIRHVDLGRLLPPLEQGIGPVLKTSLVPLTFPFGETVLFTMVTPYLQWGKDASRVWISSLILGGTLLVLATVVVTACFGPQAASRLYSVHSLARCVSIGAFVERMEVFPVIIWMCTGLTKIGVCLYAFVSGSAQLLGLRQQSPLVLPSALIMTGLSMLLYDNVTEQLDFARYTWPVYSPLFEVGLPLLLLIVGKLARRQGR
ncbi:MAG: GerAB/ArcD/ProY family transporter [Bacillota bacterium]